MSLELDVVARLMQVKRFRADQAEAALRETQAVLTASLAAAGTAERELEGWRREMPSREATIFASIIGRTVTVEALDENKRAVAELRTHEGLLAKRLEGALARAKEAQAASDDAARHLANARRNVEKCRELVQTLHRAAALDAARQEDATMEEAAGRRARPDPDDRSIDEDSIEEMDDERFWAA